MKKSLLTLLAFLMSVSALLAQVPPPPDYHENASGGPGSPSALPVDQYTIILFLLAIGVGFYVIWNKKKVFN